MAEGLGPGGGDVTFLNGPWLQTWQLTPPYAAEMNFAEVVSLAQSYGLAGIFVKAVDGVDWHASYAPEADALASVEQAVQQQAFARARGVGYGVWVNPLWGSADFLQEESALYATLGSAIGMMAFDTEPYEHFWGANRPEGDAAAFMQRFRDAAPNCVTVWQPDPRSDRLAELWPREWAPHMNVYAPQCYWTDFGVDWRSSITDAGVQADIFGIADFAPTLPGAADAAELLSAVALLSTGKSGDGSPYASGAVVWRTGTAGPSQLDALKWPVTPPADPCQKLRSDIAALIATKPYRAPSKTKLKGLIS